MSNCIEKIIKKPDDIYEFLNEYIGQFDADWKNRVEPAYEEEILNLRKVSGFEELGYDIPGEYLTFLRRMGRNDGGLLSDWWDGYTNIDYIINYYIRNRETIYKYFIRKLQ